MSQNLKSVFFNLVGKYTENHILINIYWDEIVEMYTQPNRYYHNLRHLEAIIYELENASAMIQDYDALLFAVFYHDVIYDVNNSDNEALSAALARERLLTLGIDQSLIKKVDQLILATKYHDTIVDTDFAYFLDADLAILGKNWDEYLKYAQSVRKEYSIYSNEVYSSGRKKVLQHLLHKSSIYQTTYFQHKYEHQARINLTRELEEL